MCLVFVRGFRASIRESSIRLNAIAADRAPTIAKTIQGSFASTTVALKFSSRTARKAPVRAKGSAKMECSNLIISSVRRNRFQNGKPNFRAAVEEAATADSLPF